MFSFLRSQNTVCFFDGHTVRVAVVHSDGTLEHETTFSLDTDSLGGVFSKIKDQFGKKVRLVLAETGVYTFSISIDSQENLTRDKLAEQLKGYFPEGPESTAWDYRILTEHEQKFLVEVTEMKENWYKTLLQATNESGIVFESIVPESVALAHLIPSPEPAVFIWQKADASILVTACSQGEVLTSFFFKELPNTTALTALLDFFYTKYHMQQKEVLVIGVNQAIGKGTEWKVIPFEGVFDPLLGEGMAKHPHKDKQDLNISPFLPQSSWYRRWAGRFRPTTALPQSHSGFTLLEVLIVVGIIAILATIIIVTLDPAERFRNARESRRLSDIQTIANAMHQYLIDEKGKYPDGLDEKERQIGTAKSGCEIRTGGCAVVGSTDCLDLSVTLKPYLSSPPEDPEFGSTDYTHYTIRREKESGRIVVRACNSTEEYVVQ